MKYSSALFVFAILVAFASHSVALDWIRCDACLGVDSASCQASPLLSGGQLLSECLNLTVPLEWSSDSNSIRVLVQRFKLSPVTGVPGNEGAHVQLWAMGSLLEPGLEIPVALQFLSLLTDPTESLGNRLSRDRASSTLLPTTTYTIYVLHHRGSALSTPLTCGSASTVSDCALRVKKQAYRSYTSDNAAKDVLYAMTTLRDDDSSVWVYAYDYGSFLFNKVVLLNHSVAEPIKVDKVIFEGVLPPDIGELVLADKNAQNSAGQLLQLCALSDATCEHYLYMSPASLLDTQWREMQLNGSRCSSLFRSDLVKRALSRVLSHPSSRIAFPSILKRFSRCESADIAELQFWMDFELARFSPRLAPAIAYTTLLSELFSHYEPDLSPDTVRRLQDMSPVTPFFDLQFFDKFELWPTYRPDPRTSRVYGDYSGMDVLIVHGELDPLAPWAWALHTSKHLKTPKSVDLFLVPNGLHMPSTATHDVSSANTCVARHIVKWLLGRPESRQKCLSSLDTLDFSSAKATSGTSQTLFGEPKLWGQDSTVIVAPTLTEPKKDPNRTFTWHTWVLAVTWLILVVFVLASFIILIARGNKTPHRPPGLLLAEEEARRTAGYETVSTMDE